MKPNIIEIKNDPSILAAGPIKLSEGLRPRRVVFRSLPNKYVIHDEFMLIHVEDRDGYAYVVCTHEGFDNGHYYDYGLNGVDQQDAHEEALKNYNRCLGR